MSTEPVRISYTIGMSFTLAKQDGEFEIDRDEWDQMTSDEREQYINDSMEIALSNVLDVGWEVANADIDDPTVAEGSE